MNRPLHWWITEDGLVDRSGHWFEYVQTFKEDLLSMGDTVEVFSSAKTISEVQDLLGAEPVLPESIWARMVDNASRWERLLRVGTHGWQTYRAVKRLLSERAAPDIIFVPAALVHHLTGWLGLLLGPLRGLDTKVLIFFPNTPITTSSDGTPSLRPEPTAKLFRWCLRRLKPYIDSGKVVLGAETKPMRDAIEATCGVPVIYLPHPVQLPVASQDTEENGSSGSLLLGAYGAARWEKGSDRLQEAIRIYLERHPDTNVRFAIQWINDFPDEQGTLVSADQYLREHPRVEYIDSYFSGNEYLEQVASSDALLLPYRSEYALRVSRVIIEAIMYGKPTVVTRNTTLHQQAKEFGASVVCEDDSIDSLVQSIEILVSSYPELEKVSGERSKAATQHFSVETFRRDLLAGLTLS